MYQTRLEILQCEYKLSEFKNDEIFHSLILPKYYSATEQTLNPIAVLVGGQTASGKSTLIDSSKDIVQYEGSAVEICSDNMRPYHPSYEDLVKQHPDISTYIVNDDAVKWVDKLTQLCIETRRNIILESTLKEADKIIDTINNLKNDGYRVQLKIMATHPLMSKLGMYQRYETEMAHVGFGRWIGTTIHDDRIKHLPISLKKILDSDILDSVEVYGRRLAGVENSGKFDVCLLTDEKAKAYSVLNTEHHKTFSSQEQQFFENKIRSVYEMIKNRGGDFESFVRDMNAEYLFEHRRMKR
jgi:energy-coupling factor transporter ATP-binding protein EcfA2